MVFYSKIDAWIVAIMLFAAAVPVIGVMSTAQAGLVWWPSGAIALLVVGMLAWLLLPTKYTVGNGEVLVQSGPFRWMIPGKSIHKITPSRSLVSGPALSLDRLQIDFESGRKSILVSPKDKEGFIRALQTVMPKNTA